MAVVLWCCVHWAPTKHWIKLCNGKQIWALFSIGGMAKTFWWHSITYSLLQYPLQEKTIFSSNSEYSQLFLQCWCIKTQEHPISFFTVYKRVRLYRVKKDLELVSDINNIFAPDAAGKRISQSVPILVLQESSFCGNTSPGISLMKHHLCVCLPIYSTRFSKLISWSSP